MTNPLALVLVKVRNVPDALMVLLARLAMAAFFLRAGQTKVNGFELSSSAVYLFKEEYNLPLLSPLSAAWLAVGAEHLFPLLMIIGLATRLSALALLGMTIVIEVFVYPASWPDHLMWAVLLLFIAARGPGPFALDNVLCKNRSHKVADI
ncbi:MAG TPA: DoxX family protein [Magnetovibrio sp.]